jgi:p-cumate 2,3-dioxygenase beta subunit
MTITSTATVSAGSRLVTRAEVEDFLYAEADILDVWDYDAWLALFEPGARFEIPTTDYAGHSPHASGSFVNDDWDLIKARVKRLKSRKAHAENPPSRTRHLVSNVRLFPNDDDDNQDVPTLRATAAFVVSRARDGQFDTYFGRYDHVLVVTADGLRFRRRRSILGHEYLGPGARLSFIL